MAEGKDMASDEIEKVIAETKFIDIHAHAYRIAPESAREKVFRVLANDGTVQAIALPGGGFMAHFLGDGVLSVEGKRIEGKAGDDLCVL